MTDIRNSAFGEPPRRGNGMLVSGVILLVLGLGALALGIVIPSNSAKSLTGQIGTPQATPATITSQLESATVYGVYAAPASGNASVSVSGITVTSSTGDAVTVIPTTETVKVTGPDTRTYTEVAHFAIGTSDAFTIKVPSDGSLVAVAPAKSTAGKAMAWIVAIGVGAALAVAGLILIIVAARRRSTTR